MKKRMFTRRKTIPNQNQFSAFEIHTKCQVVIEIFMHVCFNGIPSIWYSMKKKKKYALLTWTHARTAHNLNHIINRIIYSKYLRQLFLVTFQCIIFLLVEFTASRRWVFFAFQILEPLHGVWQNSFVYERAYIRENEKNEWMKI